MRNLIFHTMPSVIEIFCEEIPARMQHDAAVQIKDFCVKNTIITFQGVKVFISPCRLALYFEGLSAYTNECILKTKGPRLDAPQQAVDSFLKHNPEAVAEKNYYYNTTRIEGIPIQEYFPTFIKQLLHTLKWPKDMRWPQSNLTWIRPIRRLFCAYEGTPLSFQVEGIQTTQTITGHRFLAPTPFSMQDYEKDLDDAYVIVDQNRRQEKIFNELNALTKDKGLSILWDQKLLQEVAGLVEYPFVTLGEIEKNFMRLPKDVLITSMKFHQKYFPIVNTDGTLAPYFGVVLNCPPTEKMMAGYARVLRARLKDAEFFYQHDVAIPLESYTLGNRVYHEKLGTMQQKVERLVAFVTSPTEKRAALLCKADLKTMMVGEFPELQGIMGAIYAKAQGESEDIAQLIQDHYNGLNTLALADKIDALVGFFGVGVEPTGSKDPYALRRAALGILKILQTDDHPAPRALLQKAIAGYQHVTLSADTLERVEKFLLERLPQGVNLAHPLKESLKHLEDIQAFLETGEGEKFLTLYRRVVGLIKHGVDTLEPCVQCPSDPLEKAFFESLQNIPHLDNLYKENVATFLDGHKIFSENEGITNRRLGLLKKYYDYITQVIPPVVLSQGGV